VVTVANERRRLAELEDEVLSLLQKAGPNLLNDEVLIDALQGSKNAADEVKAHLAAAEASARGLVRSQPRRSC
jgi:hypothetical protein